MRSRFIRRRLFHSLCLFGNLTKDTSGINISTGWPFLGEFPGSSLFPRRAPVDVNVLAYLLIHSTVASLNFAPG